jgi:hypothetical protein
MKMTGTRTRVEWGIRLRVLAAAAAVVCGCGARGADVAADNAPPPSCNEYAATYGRCQSRLGADATSVQRKVEAMRRSFAARSASSPAARTELDETCSSARVRLQASCLPGAGAPALP